MTVFVEIDFVTKTAEAPVARLYVTAFIESNLAAETASRLGLRVPPLRKTFLLASLRGLRLPCSRSLRSRERTATAPHASPASSVAVASLRRLTPSRGAASRPPGAAARRHAPP
ncbi:hypothetical protein BN903_34 [Halorubrum sp. AJ67]|nr:hypothetical protein BN903_34 [Halorubrum sp. AJ67]